MKSDISHYVNDVYSFKKDKFASFRAPIDNYTNERISAFAQSKEMNDISDNYGVFYEKNKENILDVIGPDSEYLGFCLLRYNPISESENIGIFIPPYVSFKFLVQHLVHLLILNLALAFEKRDDLEYKFILDVASEYTYKAVQDALQGNADVSFVKMYDKYIIIHVTANVEQREKVLRSEKFYVTKDDTTQYVDKTNLLHSRHLIVNNENRYKLYLRYTDTYGWFYLNLEPNNRVYLVFSNYFHPNFIYEVLTQLMAHRNYRSIEFHLSIELEDLKDIGVQCNSLSDNYYVYLLEMD